MSLSNAPKNEPGDVNGNLPESFFVSWTVPLDLPAFAGHFPGRPILPAVVTIDTSIDFVRKLTGNSLLTLREIRNAKFTSPLLPGDSVRLQLEPLGPLEWQITWTGAAPTPEAAPEPSVRQIANLRLVLQSAL